VSSAGSGGIGPLDKKPGAKDRSQAQPLRKEISDIDTIPVAISLKKLGELKFDFISKILPGNNFINQIGK